MKNTQYQINDLVLPVGYAFNGYTIKQYLRHDDFSISYLADTDDVEVVLMEYFPFAMTKRDENHTDVLLQDDADQQKYTHGLAVCRDDLQDLAAFSHNHVITTHTFFEANNSIYRVSEALSEQEWLSLEDYLQDKTLSEAELGGLFSPLLEAISAIHALGHIHNDLSPSHIVVNQQTGKPMVNGFGEMKYLFHPVNQGFVRHISTGYSPCENYYGSDSQGVWTDIYALGGILYRVLTGDAPASSASRLSGLADHQSDPLISASDYFAGTDTYSEQLLAAIDHALALHKGDRPQSIVEWQSALGFTPPAVEENARHGDLLIEGIPAAPQRLSFQVSNSALDVESAAHYTYQEVPSKSPAYAPVAILGGLICTLLVGIFVYLSPAQPELEREESYSQVVYGVEDNVVGQEIEEVAEKEVVVYETDYQPIWDVPLVDNNLPFFIYINSLEVHNELSSLKTLIQTVELNPLQPAVPTIEEPPVKNISKRVMRRLEDASANTRKNTTTVKQRPRKTREQYQREWLVKQQQNQKRAEWQKRKALLEKQKQEQSIIQIADQLLAEKDW